MWSQSAKEAGGGCIQLREALLHRTPPYPPRPPSSPLRPTSKVPSNSQRRNTVQAHTSSWPHRSIPLGAIWGRSRPSTAVAATPHPPPRRYHLRDTCVVRTTFEVSLRFSPWGTLALGPVVLIRRLARRSSIIIPGAAASTGSTSGASRISLDSCCSPREQVVPFASSGDLCGEGHIRVEAVPPVRAPPRPSLVQLLRTRAGKDMNGKYVRRTTQRRQVVETAHAN